MEKFNRSTKGPIAEKLLSDIHKIKNQKIIDLSAWKTANDYQNQLKKNRRIKIFPS